MFSGIRRVDEPDGSAAEPNLVWRGDLLCYSGEVVEFQRLLLLTLQVYRVFLAFPLARTNN